MYMSVCMYVCIYCNIVPFLFAFFPLLATRCFRFFSHFVFSFLADGRFLAFSYVRLSCAKNVRPWSVGVLFLCGGCRGRGVHRTPNGLVHILNSEKNKKNKIPKK